MRIDGKRALVTGAATGIGRAIALRLARAGAHVVATDLDAAGVEATALTIAGDGGQAEARQLDVSDEAAMVHTFAEVDGAGGLDVVVNNAGIAFQMPLVATETTAFRKVLDVNVIGVFLGMREGAKRMRARGTAGRIINVASVAGLRGSSGRTAYGATKAAVINMTQVAAVELGPTGITVNAIAPGPVDTPLVQAFHDAATRAAWQSRVPQARYAEPAEIAGTCLYLASDEASFTTGQIIAVDGGFAAAGIIFDLDGDG